VTGPVSRETEEKLSRFVAMVLAENERQNLVAKSTVAEFTERHVADALQLIDLASANARWCDVGSGAGLPGLVIAIATGAPMALIEPRKLRAEFLRHCVAELGLERVQVHASKAERVSGSFDVITARAVADTSALFAMTAHLANSRTRWILPKGRSAKKELEDAQQSWQGVFSLVPSRTSDEAMIIVADKVRRRGKR
jgi:16S rRNA (guanine527-N7)-methyltransferase